MSFKLTDFITVTSTGNVGIGTTSPNRNLSIVSTTDTSVEIKSGTANQSSLWFSDTDDGNIGGVLYTHNDNAMAFRVNDSTRLTISSGGSLLVKTTATSGIGNGDIGLDNGALRGGIIRARNAADNAYKALIYLDQNDAVQVGTAATGLNISSGGEVKINTAGSGTSKLQVVGGIRNWNAALTLSSRLETDGLYFSGAQDVYVVSQQALNFYAGNALKMSISSLGTATFSGTTSANTYQH